MPEQSQPDKPSLVQPDFSGLWSVSWIGGKHNPKQTHSLLNDALSIMAQATFSMAWFCGFLSPLIILILIFYAKSYLLAVCITSIIAYPYLFAGRIRPSPAVCRYYIEHGCNYFEGGASLSYEAPPNAQSTPLSSRVPSMVAYHPHGIFCLGLFYNSGVRLQSALDLNAQQRQYFCGALYGQDKVAKDCSLRASKIPFIGLADRKLYVAMTLFCIFDVHSVFLPQGVGALLTSR